MTEVFAFYIIRAMPITDYRTYIHSAYEDKKRSNLRYSLRAFARFLELSPSTLSEIINRHHTLSTRSAMKVVEKIKLNADEAAVFMKLVHEEISFRKKAGSQIHESKKITLKINIKDKDQIKSDIEEFLMCLFDKYHAPDGQESILLKDLINESMLVMSSRKLHPL